MFAIRTVQRAVTTQASHFPIGQHNLFSPALRLRLRRCPLSRTFQTRRLSQTSSTGSPSPSDSKPDIIHALEFFCCAVGLYISYQLWTEGSSKEKEAEAVKEHVLNASNLTAVVLRRVDTSALNDLMEYYVSVIRAITLFAEDYDEDAINSFAFKLQILIVLSREEGLQHELLSILQDIYLRLHKVKGICRIDSMEDVVRFVTKSDIGEVALGCSIVMDEFETKVCSIRKAKRMASPPKDDDKVYISIG